MHKKINLDEDIQNGSIKHIHFIGIGGISMSGLAEILFRDGYVISGSDWTASDITRHLESLGIEFRLGNDADHITDNIDLVVHTAAVKPSNPEFIAAKQKKIPIIDRAKLLGLIMEGYPHSIAVSGVHGKTTTTAIIAETLLAANLDPTISIGGFMEAIGSNFRVGDSSYLVAEACEYFDSFLQFHPKIGVILNIESDHLDYFGTFDRMIDSFHRFAQNISKDGALVIHQGIPCLNDVTKDLSCEIITYGTSDARFWARDIRYNKQGLPSFYIMDGQNTVADITLKLRGTHNIDNSLAAAAVAAALNIPAEAMIKGISHASGTKRRFEYKGVFNEATIVDDYAHHPTEIKTNLAAATQGTYKRIICAFQPHTYTRTQHLMEDFAAAFDHADIVLILPIYAAREIAIGPSPNYLAELLTKQIGDKGKEVYFMDGFKPATDWIKKYIRPGDVLITMGAGDINLLGEGLLLEN